MQSCSNCFYRRDARMPGQIATTSVCAFDPPKVYILPGGNGVQVAAFQTQVMNDQWCGKWIQSVSTGQQADKDEYSAPNDNTRPFYDPIDPT